MRKEIDNQELRQVSGGNITFTPDYIGATTGKLGRDGRENFEYDDEMAVIDFIAEHAMDKEWRSVEQQDRYMLRKLKKAGLIRRIK